MHGCNAAVNTAVMARSVLLFMLVRSTQLLFHIVEMLIDIKLSKTEDDQLVEYRACIRGTTPCTGATP